MCDGEYEIASPARYAMAPLASLVGYIYVPRAGAGSDSSATKCTHTAHALTLTRNHAVYTRASQTIVAGTSTA